MGLAGQAQTHTGLDAHYPSITPGLGIMDRGVALLHVLGKNICYLISEFFPWNLPDP